MSHLRRRVKELEAALSRDVLPQPETQVSRIISTLPEVPRSEPANTEHRKNRSDGAADEKNLVQLLAEALGGNRIANSLNNIKFLDGGEGPEQVRRWFHEFELITRGWSNDERREALQVRATGRAATALQLMPRDVSDEYGKIKCELLLRLADKEPRRSANLTSMLNGSPRQSNESIEQFGARVQKLVRDALSPQCPLAQVDEIAKSYFIRWLDDRDLVPSLLEQAEHKEFRYLVDHAMTLRRSLDLYTAKSEAAPPYTSSPPHKGNRPNSGSYNAKWVPPPAAQEYAQSREPAPNTFQPRNPTPGGSIPKSGNNPGNNGNNYNAQPTWMKPAQGQFRATPGAKTNSVVAEPNNAPAVQAAEEPTHIGLLARHENTYNLAPPFAGQTHNTLSAALPVATLNDPTAGPCAIGPIPKTKVLVENMHAVALLDSGAAASIAEAGYLKGLLEGKGVDPETWPIDPPSTAISVANGDPLSCVGSTILQVSLGSGAKPVRVQLTGDKLSFPVIIGTNAFADLGIKLTNAESGASMLEPHLKPPDKCAKIELSATTYGKLCTDPPDRMRVPSKRVKRQKNRERRLKLAEPEIQLSVQAREGGDCARKKTNMRVARENDGRNGYQETKLPGMPPPSSLSDHACLNVSQRLTAFHAKTAFGQHWLRNVPRAHATFPPRPLDQLHFGSAGDAPDLLPSTSARANDTRLHSIRGRSINTHDASSRSRQRSSHDVSFRFSSRSSHDIDSLPLNEPFSVLKPSGPSSSPFDYNDQQRQ